MEHPIKMDDLGVPLFSETSIWTCKVLCLLLRKLQRKLEFVQHSMLPGWFYVFVCVYAFSLVVVCGMYCAVKYITYLDTS